MDEAKEEEVDIYHDSKGSSKTSVRKSLLIPMLGGNSAGFDGYDEFKNYALLDDKCDKYKKASKDGKRQIENDIIEHLEKQGYYFAKKEKKGDNRWYRETDAKRKQIKIKNLYDQVKKAETMKNLEAEIQESKGKIEKLEKRDLFDEYLREVMDSKIDLKFTDCLGRKGIFHGKAPASDQQFRGMMLYPRDYGIQMFQGIWTKERSFHRGILEYSNRAVYCGDFIGRNDETNDYRHGSGKWSKCHSLKFSETYVGEWQEDLRHGKGEERLVRDGGIELYEGNFEGDQRHGQGTCVYADGSKYTGEWFNGMRDGRGTEYSSDGARRDGIWVQNEHEDTRLNCEMSVDKVFGREITDVDGDVSMLSSKISSLGFPSNSNEDAKTRISDSKENHNRIESRNRNTTQSILSQLMHDDGSFPSVEDINVARKQYHPNRIL
ncbi:unnamed protein product [Cylindrotheca closterium]|uniref:Uncharacterized protein n=1 Tax=Cylindrotheca closterium TaxID=2856 RepID=A0AAD2CLN7_9STRA|nr:unnamed protein product [Cylindrotheca closterium]